MHENFEMKKERRKSATRFSSMQFEQKGDKECFIREKVRMGQAGTKRARITSSLLECLDEDE